MPRRPAARSLLNSFLGEQVQVDAELAQVLQLAARQSAAQVRRLNLKKGTSVGARVRAAQFQQVLSEILRIQSDLWVDGVQGTILRNLERAERAAEASLDDVGLILENAVGERRAAALLEGFRQAAKAGMRLDRTRRARALSARVWKNASLAQGRVERLIRAGIIQGLTARELAQNVRSHISPTTPGGVGYAAMRLARTELNNAFHEAQKHTAAAPWVRAVRWNLSGTHKSRVKGTDKCDLMATQNIFDLGPGRYPADEIPDKPHPQCLCFVTYESVSETEMLDMLPAIVRARRATA
jgi:hypothetical protein